MTLVLIRINPSSSSLDLPPVPVSGALSHWSGLIQDINCSLFIPLLLTFNMSRFSVFMKWRTFTKFKHLCMKGFYCLVYQLYPHLSELALHCSINTELVIQSYHCFFLNTNTAHMYAYTFWFLSFTTDSLLRANLAFLFITQWEMCSPPSPKSSWVTKNFSALILLQRSCCTWN